MDLFPNHRFGESGDSFHTTFLDIPAPVYMNETGREGIEYVPERNPFQRCR